MKKATPRHEGQLLFMKATTPSYGCHDFHLGLGQQVDAQLVPDSQKQVYFY